MCRSCEPWVDRSLRRGVHRRFPQEGIEGGKKKPGMGIFFSNTPDKSIDITISKSWSVIFRNFWTANLASRNTPGNVLRIRDALDQMLMVDL